MSEKRTLDSVAGVVNAHSKTIKKLSQELAKANRTIKHLENNISAIRGIIDKRLTNSFDVNNIMGDLFKK